MFYINEELKEDYDNKTNIINNYINNYHLNKNKIEINVNELQINDIILIEFIPDSQKYLYDLYPKFGIIINIKDDIIIKNINNEEELMFHGNISYYGSSLGYSYNIYKFI